MLLIIFSIFFSYHSILGKVGRKNTRIMTLQELRNREVGIDPPIIVHKHL